jgi:serine/threonine-protein kinase
VGNGGTQLFVRALDALAPVAVFTGTPRGPFVSPDGQWIGFVDTNAVLKKVAVTGGPTTVLTRPDRAQGELGHIWPEMLPGGRGVLFTIAPQTGGSMPRK